MCKNQTNVPFIAVEEDVQEKSLQEQIMEQAREIALLKRQVKILCENCNLQNIL